MRLLIQCREMDLIPQWIELSGIPDLLKCVDDSSFKINSIIELTGESCKNATAIQDVGKYIANARKQIKYHKLASELDFHEDKVLKLQDELAELEEAQS